MHSYWDIFSVNNSLLLNEYQWFINFFDESIFLVEVLRIGIN
jgi:hypothetical protein